MKSFLVIDAGNSRCKTAVFSGGNIIFSETVSSLSLTMLQQTIAAYNPAATIVSSVIILEQELLEFLDLLPNIMILNADTPLPIENLYSTPATQGADRLANAIGCSRLFPGKNALAIDAGTCLKFDFINGKGQYLGGSISPGLYMRFEALHRFTARLPLLAPVEHPPLTGNSTAASITSGVINGMAEEIKGMISRYENQYSDLQIVITGGDAPYFLNHLKKTIFASPELTLKGLYNILLHNFPDEEQKITA